MKYQPITKRQCQILEYICNSKQRNKYFPTLQEIAIHFNVKTSTIQGHIKELHKRGRIQRVNHKSNSFIVIRDALENKDCLLTP